MLLAVDSHMVVFFNHHLQPNRTRRVLNGHAAISPEMALRIEKWLGVENGGRADLWLAEQASYDLWQARTKFNAKVKSAELLKV